MPGTVVKKRERGLGMGVGTFRGGMLKLSRGEIAQVQGTGSGGRGGGRGGRGGRGSRGGSSGRGRSSGDDRGRGGGRGRGRGRGRN